MSLLQRSGSAIAEWAIWVLLALIALQQTGKFDQTVSEYLFGASGWPRMICYAILSGATGQLIHILYRDRHSPVAETGQERPAFKARPERQQVATVLQRAAFFILPFVFLYATPRFGFYLTTPFFIVAMLALREVRSLRAFVAVTAVIYGIALLVFTRFFYVALPVGHISPFYEINTAIITIARTGM